MFEASRDLSKLDPVMRGCVLKFMVLCSQARIKVLITEARRSKARHFWLWCKGRIVSKSQEVAFLGYDDPNIASSPKEKQVTWTLRSNHLTGKAIDICFLDPNGRPTWNGPWERVFQLAKYAGLASLYQKYGTDKPHLELPGLS